MALITQPRFVPSGPLPNWSGSLHSVHVAEAGGVEMHEIAVARLIPGVGIDGDRYATRRGHYEHLWHPDRQVTIIAHEVVEKVAAVIGQPFEPIETRRNLTTRGVPVNDLAGVYFTVGEAVLYGGRLNVPCRYFERLIDKPVFEPLVGISGLNCQVIRGGVLQPGDVIRPLWDWDEADGAAVR